MLLFISNPLDVAIALLAMFDSWYVLPSLPLSSSTNITTLITHTHVHCFCYCKQLFVIICHNIFSKKWLPMVIQLNMYLSSIQLAYYLWNWTFCHNCSWKVWYCCPPLVLIFYDVRVFGIRFLPKMYLISKKVEYISWKWDFLPQSWWQAVVSLILALILII